MVVQAFEEVGVPWPDEPGGGGLPGVGPRGDEPPLVLRVLVWSAPGVLDVERTLERLLGEPPGPGVGEVMAVLAEVPRSGLARRFWLQLTARQLAWWTAAQHVAVAEVVDEVAGGVMEAEAEVALALRVTNRSGFAVASLARHYRDDLPGVLAALADGRFSTRHAAAVVDVVARARSQANRLPRPPGEREWAGICAQVEARVIPKSAERTPPQVAAACWRVLHRLLPDLARCRDLTAVVDRGVEAVPGHGRVSLVADLPAVDGRYALALVEALASHPGVPVGVGAAAGGASPVDRSAGQAEADALLWALHHTAHCPTARAELDTAPVDGPRAGPRVGPAVQVQVVVDLPTLLGLADHPGELVGFGPVSADLARLLAADGDWRRWVTDPVRGHLLDHGRSTYRPPKPLADYLRARDGVCTMPTCTNRIRDLDHQPAWDDGGTTSAAGLRGTCRTCHNHKTHGRFTYRTDHDGLTWVTTPLGATYPLPPRQVLPPPDPPVVEPGPDPQPEPTPPPDDAQSTPPF